MAEIQLKKSWGGFPPWTIKNVSSERAAYLIDEGIAKYTPEQLKLNEKDVSKTTKSLNTRLKNYQEEYNALLEKGKDRTPEETARGDKLETLMEGIKKNLEEA